MTPKPSPAWPLPLIALLQAVVGAGFVSILWTWEGSWSAGSAAVAAFVSVVGLLLLALATRKCVRLWRVPPGDASWGLAVATVLAALIGALVVAGSISDGASILGSILIGGFLVYLVVVLVREVRRRLTSDPELSQPADS